MEHQRCYIYSPAETQGRAPKRQKLTKANNPLTQLPERLQAYREIWSHQEERIQTTLEEGDGVTLEKIANFISSTAKPGPVQSPAIPTGLVLAGPSIASHGPFFERLGRKIKQDVDSAYLLLTSGECPNLKTLLKNLIKKATSRIEDDDDEDLERPSASSRNGPKLLDFDLGHLLEWQNKHKARKIVVALRDSEAFDANVLTELIDLLYSWLDRLPFVLLFGIATSTESFEDRLSGRVLRYLEGQKFDVTQSDEIIDKLFRATVASTDVSLRIGPNLARRVLGRQKDHLQNVQDFSDGLKYAYMSHFYANQLSIFLKVELALKDLTSDAFEATRNLPSFRRYIEGLVDSGRTEEARKLLTSDQDLFESITQHVESSREVLSALSGAATMLTHIRDTLHMSPPAPLSSVWIRAASGEMAGSPILRETMLAIKKVSSDKLAQLFASFDSLDTSYLLFDTEQYQRELEELLKENSNSTPLRTQHDVRNDSLRTTVVAQKVLLSKHKAALSEQDKAYSELVGRFHDELEDYFTTTFIDPRALFLSEILMFDLRSPHTEVFQPKPRFAIERSLASPYDYLGCDCCGPDGEQEAESALSSSQPATAILYQLYLESGMLINVSDLYSAFNAIAGEGNEDEDSTTRALFQRALAELKYLGLLKPSRKKTDHVSKMMWKGL
ncbi:origin recognition complex subunit [Clohesyomyces aquaticus]|uniref:Origin recognition complex subunit n=1 Tax=Clohesyomyces aquaticus TaxID=1231657 RepID=A0A1Y2AA62_9PLEO|nr:origin recognition complex subunit [Clohesyomyces aquaticus]